MNSYNVNLVFGQGEHIVQIFVGTGTEDQVSELCQFLYGSRVILVEEPSGLTIQNIGIVVDWAAGLPSASTTQATATSLAQWKDHSFKLRITQD